MNNLLIILSFVFLISDTLFAQPVDSNNIIITADTTVKTVTNESICGFIPNVFSPNRDGENDEWCIKTKGADICVLYLWTRSDFYIFYEKEYVIETTGAACLWDNGIGSSGTTYGNAVYYYYIVLKNTSTGEEKTFTGSVLLY